MEIKWFRTFVISTVLAVKVFQPSFSQELFTKYSHLDYYLDSETQGVKVILPCIDFRFYQSGENEIFAFSWFSDKLIKSFPCSIKVGQLSPGGLYSKLKNPLISTSVSPFSSASSEATCLTATLPSAKSSFKNDSYFLQAGITNKKTFFRDLRLNCWYSPDEQLEVFSAKLKVSPAKGMTLAISTCAGYFGYSDNESTSWFVDEQYYCAGTHFCNVSQLSFMFSGISSLFTLGTYESPFGTYTNVYRTETKLKSDHFIFTFSSAWLPQKTITSSDSILMPNVQGKAGLQYYYMTGRKIPVFVKTGVNTYCKIEYEQKEYPVKFGTGLQVSMPFTAITLTGSVNGNLSLPNSATSQLQFEGASISLKNVWYFRLLSPGFTISQSYNPSADFTSISTTENYEFNLNLTTNPRISDKSKIIIKRNNWQITSRTFLTDITVKGSLKNLNLTCKLGLEMEF